MTRWLVLTVWSFGHIERTDVRFHMHIMTLDQSEVAPGPLRSNLCHGDLPSQASCDLDRVGFRNPIVLSNVADLAQFVLARSLHRQSPAFNLADRWLLLLLNVIEIGW